MRDMPRTFAFVLSLSLAALSLGACDAPAGQANDSSSKKAPAQGVGIGQAASSVSGSVSSRSNAPWAIDFAIPDTEFCRPVRDWEPRDMDLERQVLVLSNELRAQGLECGDEGNFPPVPPLKFNSALICAARRHSQYMFENEVFDHLGPEGQTPGDRIALTGYPVTAWGENIAFGFPTAEAVVEAWRTSDSHCANLMRPHYTQMGVGLVVGPSSTFHWTQVMATGEDLPPNLDGPAAPVPVLGGMGAFLLCLGLGRAVYGARRSRGN